MNIRKGIIKVREGEVRGGKGICEQSDSELATNLREMKLVIVRCTSLYVVENGGKIEETAVKPVGLGRSRAWVVSVGPIANGAHVELPCDGDGAEEGLVVEFGGEPLSDVVQGALAFTTIVSQGIVVGNVTLDRVDDNAGPVGPCKIDGDVEGIT